MRRALESDECEALCLWLVMQQGCHWILVGMGAKAARDAELAGYLRLPECIAAEAAQKEDK